MSWRQEISQSITSPENLKSRLPISDRIMKSIEHAASAFPIVITPYYFNLIDASNPRDPIRRQAVPSPAELWRSPAESSDPLLEKQHSPLPGLIHKYRNRVLIAITSRCAVHCRFCFRKHSKAIGSEIFPEDRFQSILKYIQKRKFIEEVILSGGDPFILEDDTLASVVSMISSIPAIRLLRIHTRIPAVLPSRITPELIHAIKSSKTCWIVTHFNHPTEVTREAIEACDRLLDSRIALLNQSVLLRGVNDNSRTLAALFQELVVARIKPYYLHMLDRVSGASHFLVPDREASILMSELSSRLSGYAAPKLVRDIPGASGKMEIF